MEGGTGPVGPFPNVLVAILVVLALPATVGLALWLGERARSDGAVDLTLARTRRAYYCFVAWGAFILSFGLAALISNGLAEGVGIVGGIPAGPIVAIGAFHALMVWRLRLIRILLGASVVLLPFVFSDFFRDPWTTVIAVAYGVLVVGVSVYGLRGLGTSAASRAGPDGA